MFPNVRLMIVTVFVSVAALSCGFGVFAAFRVNHEPFMRSPAGKTPLRLAAANVASSDVRLAAEETFGSRFPSRQAEMAAAIAASSASKPDTSDQAVSPQAISTIVADAAPVADPAQQAASGQEPPQQAEQPQRAEQPPQANQPQEAEEPQQAEQPQQLQQTDQQQADQQQAEQPQQLQQTEQPQLLPAVADNAAAPAPETPMSDTGRAANSDGATSVNPTLSSAASEPANADPPADQGRLDAQAAPER